MCCLTSITHPQDLITALGKRTTVCVSYLSKCMLLGVVVGAVLFVCEWVTYLNVHRVWAFTAFKNNFCSRIKDQVFQQI